jgi:hypothetical protein
MTIKKVDFPHDFAVWLHIEAIDHHSVEMDGVTNGRLLVIAWASIHVIKLIGIRVALRCQHACHTFAHQQEQQMTVHMAL